MMNKMEINDDDTFLVSVARQYHSPTSRIIHQSHPYWRPTDTNETRLIRCEHNNGIGRPLIQKFLPDRTHSSRPVSADRRYREARLIEMLTNVLLIEYHIREFEDQKFLWYRRAADTKVALLKIAETAACISGPPI